MNTPHHSPVLPESVFIARVQKLGRIAIPKPVREALRIKDGDTVRVRIRKERE